MYSGDTTLPDVETTDLVFESIVDTLSGNESLSLTYAQQFAEGVLLSSGHLTFSVAGNESVFSKVGGAMAASWKWLKDMFSKLWGVFFKKEVKEEIKEAKEEVNNLGKEAKGFTEKELAGEGSSERIGLANRFKQKCANRVEKTKATLAAWKDFGPKTLENLSKSIEDAIIARDKAKEAKAKSDTDAKAKAEEEARIAAVDKEIELMKQTSKSLEELTKDIEDTHKTLEKLTSGESAFKELATFMNTMGKLLSSMEKNSGAISKLEGDIKKLMDTAEKYAENHGLVGNNSVVKQQMTSLRQLMVSSNGSAGFIKRLTGVFKSNKS